MHPSTFPFVFLFAILTSLPGVSGFAQPRADEATIAYLQKFRSAYARGMLDAQPELITAYYDEAVRLMPEFQKTVMGHAHASSYHQAFLTCFTVQNYDRTETEIIDLGTQVVEIGSFSMKVLEKTPEQQHALDGKYMTVWKKQGDTLTLLTEAWNYNHPLEIESHLKFTQVPTVDISFQAHLPIDTPLRFELAALNQLMEATVTQHDAHVWSQFYADDGMFLYSRNPVYQGRKALDDFFEVHAKESPIFEKLDIRNDRADDLGQYVIEYASHTAIIRNGDFSGVFTGKDLRIWRREPAGSLKIFRHIGMYD
ncbi:MAG: nuclear transport factor 2 family protein [Cyclobacteriaceae bacterium]